jgi:F-type H+-transporting ATPase subunit c
MRFIKSAVLALGLLLVAHGAAYAADAPAGGPFSDLKAVGAGLVILGAAMGIGGLARAAVESMARQPEIAGNIQTAMIIAAALIEGVTFFALIIILLQVIL